MLELFLTELRIYQAAQVAFMKCHCGFHFNANSVERLNAKIDIG